MLFSVRVVHKLNFRFVTKKELTNDDHFKGGHAVTAIYVSDRSYILVCFTPAAVAIVKGLYPLCAG